MKRKLDFIFLLAGIGLLALFTTRYRMPFRLDDVLLMLWAKTHSFSDIFDPLKGQMINSFRPVFTLTAFLLSRFAGWAHPFWWHLTLDLSLLTGIAFMGFTARYLIGRWYAMEISILLYWLAFLPILNIFFWYSDLTYGLEIAFAASSWYFGLRGLYESRIGLWLTGMLLGCFAVLSKEPAFVLVHVVLLGSFLLERRKIIAAWSNRGGSRAAWAIVAYVLLVAVTAWVAFISPTRANRFFQLNTPDLAYFIRDRIDYYSAIYLSITARVLLFSPIVYTFLRIVFEGRLKKLVARQFPYVTVLALVLSVLLFQNVLVALPLVVFVFITLATLPNPERDRIRRLLPFLACLLLAMAALLFTIQLVKTQLTEAALLTAILSSWAWCMWVEDFQIAIEPYRSSKAFRTAIFFMGLGIAVVFVIGIYPRLLREERLLREVRDVRMNANNAVQWAAEHLPDGSLLAVTEYDLYGFDNPNALTPKDDETKLEDQYTFAGGFVFDALNVLGRDDFRRTFLADSILLPRVLDGMRETPNSYVFLQSKLDFNRFHGLDGYPKLLTDDDSLIAHFSRGPYPCEIWLLKK